MSDKKREINDTLALGHAKRIRRGQPHSTGKQTEGSKKTFSTMSKIRKHEGMYSSFVGNKVYIQADGRTRD